MFGVSPSFNAMNARLSGLKSHFTHWREWELNPIVIKELRQAVRSWAVTGMLLLFLTVLFIASLTFLVTQSFNVDANMGLGGSMFSTFVAILAGASIFFIPLYVGVRLAVERQENNPDLLYVTTLSPARIIRGKFYCGAYMTLLFFSAVMPFMAFANLLRGVDLPTEFFILCFLFLVVCATNMISIFLACIPASRPFKILLALGGCFASFWIIVPLVELSYEMLRSGVGTMMAGRDFWIGTVTVLGIGVAILGLFFVLAVALISPASANRALPVRIYITIIWLLGLILSVGWVAQTGEGPLMFAWLYPTFALMMLALLVTVSNSDQLSLRVRWRIPQSGFRRVLAFVFFNGAAGGLIWVGIILALTGFATQTVMTMFPSPAFSVPSGFGQWFITISAYAFAYALSALFIHRQFLPKRPPKFAGLIAILIPSLMALVPSVVMFFLNRLTWNSLEGLQLGNVFNLLALREDYQRDFHLYFAVAWLAVMMALNATWFFRQVNNFQLPIRVVPGSSPPILK